MTCSMRVADPCLCALREQSLPSGRLPLDCLARLTFRSASGVVGLVAMDAQGRRRLAMCPSRRVCSGVILYRHCHQIKNKKIKKGDTVVGIRYSNSTHTRHTTGRRRLAIAAPTSQLARGGRDPTREARPPKMESSPPKPCRNRDGRARAPFSYDYDYKTHSILTDTVAHQLNNFLGFFFR